jgi:UDP-N-acetylmuramyl pentapeptide phosphotransferase/UDP-N-acetylglucosamine-1-phosphate transferase
MAVTAFAVGAGTFLLSYQLTAGARWLAPRIGLVDRPDGARKLHARPMPLMGGVAICAALFLAVLILSVALPWLLATGRSGVSGLFPLLASTGLFCLLGCWDDRWGLRPRYKLVGQIVASLPFAIWGRSIGSIEVLGILWDLGVWNVPLTVFWLVACSNVINLMDGMDGLAGTISCIALLTLAALSVVIGRHEIAVVALLAAASVAGFLMHNWPPARIFMGDSGSLMLGFLIGALAIEAALKQAAGFTLVVPLVLISIPVFDTAMAILRRKLTGRGIGEADRGHIHHRLQDRGLSRVQSLLLISGLCVAMAAVAVLSFWVDSEVLALSLCGSLLAALVVGRVFGHHETDLVLGHLRLIGCVLLETSRMIPSRLLSVQLENMEPQRRQDYWRRVCTRVEQLGGKRLEFRFSDARDRQVFFRLTWTADASAESGADAWQLTHTTMRDGEIRATLMARGIVPNPQSASRLSEASQLLYTLCRTWPLEDLLAGFPDETLASEATRIQLFDPDSVESDFAAASRSARIPGNAATRRAA